MAEPTKPAATTTAAAAAAAPIRPKNERAQDPDDTTHISQAYELTKMTNAYSAHWQDQLQRRGSHTSQDRAARAADAGQVSDDYYNFVSPIYEHFWGQTFHYCPVSPGKGIQASMHEYDTMFAGLVGIKEGMKVLDVGCGVGGPARTIASEKGCFVTGVTRNEWHIERGRVLTKEAGLEGRVVHVKADFMVGICFPERIENCLMVLFLCFCRNSPSKTQASTPSTPSMPSATRPMSKTCTRKSTAC